MKSILTIPKLGTMRLTIFKSFGRLNLHLKSFNALFSVKRKGGALNGAFALLRLFLIKLTPRRIRLIYFILIWIKMIFSTQGPKKAIVTLKVALVAVQQSLGGDRTPDLFTIGKARFARNRQGLPMFIPREFRLAIRRGEIPMIRFVLSVLSFYRFLEMRGEPAFSTITAPNEASMTIFPRLVQLIPAFVKLFITERFSGGIKPLAGTPTLFPIYKSAPGLIKEPYGGTIMNYSTHPVQIILLARALLKAGLWPSIRVLAETFANHHLLGVMDFLEKENPTELQGPCRNTVGKLAVKEEAAGKVRIFAIVDPWTQWAMKPLHDALFKVLEGIPMDGTFDQLRPIGFLKPGTPRFSLDLTAATDRMPIVLQEAILTELFGASFASAWVKVLVDRRYGFHQLGWENWHGQYQYKVGQPMGALSSWSMLAITHHFIVQASAWLSGFTPVGQMYMNYAVLGDDLVLGDKPVRDAYIRILDSLGMPVNLSKSIQSMDGTALEFAKKTFYKGVNVSPITLTELASAQKSIPSFIEFMKKYSLNFRQMLLALGYGWKTLTWLNKPLWKLPSQVRVLWLSLHAPQHVSEVKLFWEFASSQRAKYREQNVPYIDAVLRLMVQQLLDRVGWVKFRLEQFFMSDPSSFAYLLAQMLTYIELTDGVDPEDTLFHNLEGVLLERPRQSEDAEPTPQRVIFFKSIWKLGLQTAIFSSHATCIQVQEMTNFDDDEQEYIDSGGEAIFARFMYLFRLMDAASHLSPHIFKFEREEDVEIDGMRPIPTNIIRFWRTLGSFFTGAVSAQTKLTEDAKRKSRWSGMFD